MCWISIETQLPKEGEAVDIWVVKNSTKPGQRFCNTTFFEGVFMGGLFDTPVNEVTHWRYPPAPPEGK